MKSLRALVLAAFVSGAVLPLARAETTAVIPAESTIAPAPLQPAPSAPPAPPALLPSEIRLAEPMLVPVPGDKPVLVVHAPAENRRAIVYLHGMCGNVRAVEQWKAAAARHGTLIGLVGDRACGAGRFKWSKTVEPIQARIDRALDAVRTARGGLLETSEVVLFGYSQGADRASLLARRFSERYRRVVLGGPSREPRLVNLGDTRAVAVFGGELETTWHMRSGAEVLAAAGKPARFFLLPSAKHGEFGPEGDRVIGEVLSWVLTAPDSG